MPTSNSNWIFSNHISRNTMKHLTTNTEQASSAGKLETLLLLALFFFGIWGILQVFTKRSSRHSDRIETMVALPATLSNSQLALAQGNAHLKIRPVETGNIIVHFQIRSFNKDGRYVLEFGDGSQLEMRGSTTTYAYPGAGQYRVKLKYIREGKAEELYNDILRIKPSGELAQREDPVNF